MENIDRILDVQRKHETDLKNMVMGLDVMKQSVGILREDLCEMKLEMKGITSKLDEFLAAFKEEGSQSPMNKPSLYVPPQNGLLLEKLKKKNDVADKGCKGAQEVNNTKHHEIAEIICVDFESSVSFMDEGEMQGVVSIDEPNKSTEVVLEDRVTWEKNEVTKVANHQIHYDQLAFVLDTMTWNPGIKSNVEWKTCSENTFSETWRTSFCFIRRTSCMYKLYLGIDGNYYFGTLVGNLSIECISTMYNVLAALVEIFVKEVGEITEVRLMMNPKTKKNKGFAFLRFARVDQAKRACTQQKNPMVQCKQCGVSPSQDSDTLFLGNISWMWSKEALKKKLKHYGVDNIEDLTMVEDNNNAGRNRGFAFLEFSSWPEAVDAVKQLQKRDVVFGADRPAKVSFADLFINPGDEIMAQVKIVFLDGLSASGDDDYVKKLLKHYEELKERTNQSQGTWDEVYRSARRMDRSLSERESYLTTSGSTRIWDPGGENER